MNHQSVDITAFDCFTLNSHLVASVRLQLYYIINSHNMIYLHRIFCDICINCESIDI